MIPVTYDTVTDLIRGAQKGQVRAIMLEGANGQALLEDMGLAGELTMVPTPVFVRELHIGVKAGQADLLKKINAGLGSITTAEVVEIEKRWINDPDNRLYANRPREVRLTEKEKHWLADHKQIRIAIDPAWPPFEYFSPKGEHQGISAEYVRIIQERLGIHMQIIPGLKWSEVVNRLKARTVDAVPLMALTPKRATFAVFSTPYLHMDIVLVTRKDQIHIGDLKELQGRKLAMIRDYAVGEMLKKDYPDQELLLVDSLGDGLKAVDEGKADAYMDNRVSVEFAMEKWGLDSLKISGMTPYNYDLGFCSEKRLAGTCRYPE